MTETTTLSRRDLGFNPTALSANEFVNMIMQDVETAKQTYFEITSRKAEERYERDKKDYFERREKAIAKIVEDSYKKYTIERYRLRWVEKESSKWPMEFKKTYWHKPEELTYVDWSMKPWKMGTSCISFTRNTADEVKEFFKDMFLNDYNNKYFSRCTGWEIVVNQRPYFKPILSDELEAEWKADEKRLYDSINHFYSNSNYWGD